MEDHSAATPTSLPTRWRNLPTWLLSQTANHAHHLVTAAFTTENARGYHYRLLATLADHGPASQAELGRRSGIHVSDMVATINELTRRRQVERAPDPADGRRNIISLTAAGRQQLERLEEQLARAQDELLSPLSSAERRQLSELLGHLLDHHGQAGGPVDNG